MSNRIQMARTLAILLVLAMVSGGATWAQDAQGTLESKSDGSPNGPLFVYPRIKDHGKVVRLPNAVDQPRSGSKICIDVTAGGPWEKTNPAIEKVARFVNIYAGAGKTPAAVRVTVILHGDATLTALSAKAYATRFHLDGNPNLRLFEQLNDAGVEILVCGQSLTQKGGRPEDVAKKVEIAVSALTANVNRQMEGYAFIPLH